MWSRLSVLHYMLVMRARSSHPARRDPEAAQQRTAKASLLRSAGTLQYGSLWLASIQHLILQLN